MATESELIILRIILEHDGEWNWYKVGRRCMSLLDPGQIDLKSLKDAHLVSEHRVDGEPLPRLRITGEGKTVLEEALEEGGLNP
jgi:hypothetical protein